MQSLYTIAYKIAHNLKKLKISQALLKILILVAI